MPGLSLDQEGTGEAKPDPGPVALSSNPLPGDSAALGLWAPSSSPLPGETPLPGLLRVIGDPRRPSGVLSNFYTCDLARLKARSEI